VLAYYYFRSGALVADPLTPITADLLPLAVLQSLFYAVCLPAAGTWVSGRATTTTPTTSSSMTTGRKTEVSDVGKGAKGRDGEREEEVGCAGIRKGHSWESSRWRGDSWEWWKLEEQDHGITILLCRLQARAKC